MRKDKTFSNWDDHMPVAVRLSYHKAEPERLEDIYLNYLEVRPDLICGKFLLGVSSIPRSVRATALIKVILKSSPILDRVWAFHVRDSTL